MNPTLLLPEHLTDTAMMAGYSNYLRLTSPAKLVEELQTVGSEYLATISDLSVSGILSSLSGVQDSAVVSLVKQYSELHSNPVYSVIESMLSTYSKDQSMISVLLPALSLSPKDARDVVIKHYGHSTNPEIQSIIAPLRGVRAGVSTAILTRHGRVSIHHKEYPVWTDTNSHHTYILLGTILVSVQNSTVTPVSDWDSVPNEQFINTCKAIIKLNQYKTPSQSLKKIDTGYALYESSIPVDPAYITPSVGHIINTINAGTNYLQCSRFIYSITTPDGIDITIMKTGSNTAVAVDSEGAMVEVAPEFLDPVEAEMESMGEDTEILNENPFMSGGTGENNGEEESPEDKEKEIQKKIQDGIDKLEDRVTWIKDRISVIEDSDNAVKDDQDIKDYYLKLQGELSILTSKINDLKNKDTSKGDINDIIIKDSVYESYTPTMVESTVNLLLEHSLFSPAEQLYFLEDYARVKVGLRSVSYLYETYDLEQKLSTLSINDTSITTDHFTDNFIVLPITLKSDTVIDGQFRMVYEYPSVYLQRRLADTWIEASILNTDDLLNTDHFTHEGVTISYSISELTDKFIRFGIIDKTTPVPTYTVGQYYLFTEDIVNNEILYAMKGQILLYTPEGFVEAEGEVLHIPLDSLDNNNCVPISTILMVGSKYIITDAVGMSKSLKLINIGYSTTLDLTYTFVSDTNEMISLTVDDLATCSITL